MGRRVYIAGVVSGFGFAAVCAALAAPGQLDSSFGAGGKVLTDAGGADWVNAIAPSGAVVVAAASGADVALALVGDIALVRYLSR